MTQLVLDTGGINLTLPESIKGGYDVQNSPLAKEVEMASGRLTREIRGHIWMITYQYGYLDDEQKAKFVEACEKGWRQAITCAFLTPTGGGMITSQFLVTDFSYPKFMWSRLALAGADPIPMWGDYHVTLREVSPHD